MSARIDSSESDSAAEELQPRADLTRAALGAVSWQGLSTIIGKILVLISTTILARLLSPEHFGTVALALVVITYLDVITDLGMGQALVFLPADRKSNDAALGLSLLVSGALTLMAVAAAPLVADFFDRPDIAGLVRVLSISLFLGATGQVPDALLRKGLDFRRRVLVNLAQSAGQGLVSVALALAGAGPWAIAYGYLAGYVARSVMGWWLIDYRPGLRFWRISRSAARPLVKFGLPVTAQMLLVSFIFNIDYLIVGKVLGSEALGYYTLAFRIPQVGIISVFYIVSAVAFPLFSRAREDPRRLRRGFLRSTRLTTSFGMGMGVGLAVVAPMLVHVLFGRKWEPAIAPLQAIALYASFRSLGNGAGDVYKGIGRPQLSVRLSLVRLTVLLPILLVAVRFGINAVSWAQAGVALGMALLMQGVAARVLGIPLRDLATALLPALTLGLGVAIGAGVVRLWMPGSEEVRLAAAVLAGAMSGFVAVWILHRSFVAQVRSMLTRRAAVQTSSA